MTRPFRFGVQGAGLFDRAGWLNLARHAEASGFSVLTVPDHFDEQLAPIAALMAAGSVTSTLRLGQVVLDNDYRHPVVLAKELATIDLLTDGRLEIGLGAGWLETDYDRAGMTYDPAPTRVDRFIEGVAVIRGLMSPGPFSFEGRHYRIERLDGTPKPAQARPPLLIGGGGRRMLTFAAREADIVGINGTMNTGVRTSRTAADGPVPPVPPIGHGALTTISATAVDDKVAIVREAAGERFPHVELSVRAFLTSVTDDRTGALAAMSDRLGVSQEFLEQTPFALVGPPSKIVEDLLERRQRWGLSYIVVGPAEVESFVPVIEQLAGR